MEPVQSAQK